MPWCPRCGAGAFGQGSPATCDCEPYARPSKVDEATGEVRQLGLFEAAELVERAHDGVRVSGPPLDSRAHAGDGEGAAREAGAPFQRHSDTSQEAAEAIMPAAETERGRVLCVLRANPDGLTDEEMQKRLDMNPSTQRPRRIELCRSGIVCDSGDRRLTDAGRRAVVWCVV